MRESIRQICFIVASSLFLMTTTGCIPLVIGAAAGAGGVAFVRGKLEKNIDENVVSIHKAALAACKKLNIMVTDDEVTQHSASVKGIYEDKEKLIIEAVAFTERASTIKIRIGIIGDEEKSYKVLNTMLEYF